MKHRKLLVSLMVGTVFIGLLFWGITLFRSPSTTDTAAKPVVKTSNAAQAVVLTNAADLSSWLPKDNAEAAERALYRQVLKYTSSPNPSYEGTIRRDSFKTTWHDYESDGQTGRVPRIEYVVDIPTLGQSYKVSDAGGESYPYHIIYVLCVDQQQQKYDSFGCVDDED